MNSFSITNSFGTKITGKYIENLPNIKFLNNNFQSYLSQSELLHKSLGHASYHRLRQRLGLQIKDFKTCEACAVAKVTKKSFHTRHSRASKPFEEIHLDLVGPIFPSSREGHRYFLTVVNSCTSYCSAIPVRSKNEVSDTIAQVISLEAKRLGYFPTVIHSDCGSKFINSIDGILQ
ncbi:hypothetical protein VP01_1367g8 [Puccinia sorghi]|uniref:Integrase catalytic domain-containing protein n=1 Tax=Puccinia sorghi TaxID=27349 RepID=A0A0L6VMA7_9BASI|nr:hypothetical protein VP01_1367g8 [Puccinia sorghi]